MSVALYMDVHVHAAVTEQLRRRGVDVLTAQDDDQPPGKHFFHAHNGAGDRLRCGFHARVQRPMPGIAFIGANRKMVGVEQDHEWA
jgi:hypothetical protein